MKTRVGLSALRVDAEWQRVVCSESEVVRAELSGTAVIRGALRRAHVGMACVRYVHVGLVIDCLVKSCSVGEESCTKTADTDCHLAAFDRWYGQEGWRSGRHWAHGSRRNRRLS